MKILIINFEYPPLGGGGGVATMHLAAQLAQRHTVHVLTSSAKGKNAYEVQQNIHIHRVRIFGRRNLSTSTILSLVSFVPSAVIAGWRLLHQHSFDVINAQFVLPSGIPAALLAKVFHLPLVVSFIGGDVYDPTNPWSPHRFGSLRFLIRLISRQAIAGTAISNDTAKRVRQLHGVRLPITVIPLGFVPRTISSVGRASLNLPLHEKLLVSVGRLIPRKGYEILLDALSQIPKVHLAIVGAGPNEKMLKDLSAKLKIEDRVHWLGFVSEDSKFQILKVANVYISAASHEGFGIVFLEAMAAGLPIIACNNGGQTDFLDEGQNALLVPPNNSSALRDATQALLENNELQERMRRQNLIKIQSYYIDRTAALFEEILSESIKNYQSKK